MNGSELVVLIIVALVIFGPERLPQAAEQLARLVRELKRMAQDAKETVRTELGDEVADIDLAKLDLRQYDPRRIVREALLEDLTPSKPGGATSPAVRTAARTGGGAATARPAPGAAAPASAPAQPSRRAALTSPAAVVAAATRADAPAGTPAAAVGNAPEQPDPAAPPAVPFDDEAT